MLCYEGICRVFILSFVFSYENIISHSFALILFIINSTCGNTQINDSISKADKVASKDRTQKDIGGLIHKKDKLLKTPKKIMVLVLPNVSSNPANGFLLGVGGSAGWSFGSKEITHVSTVGYTAAFTTKNQFLSFIKSNIYTENDRFFLQGDWRYYIYQSPTWGLGTDAPDPRNTNNGWVWQGADLELADGSYPLLYDYIKFHEIDNYKVKKVFVCWNWIPSRLL